MAIHVQDDEADRMVREFARRRGIGLTAAIKLAVTEATLGEKTDAQSLRRRIEPILQKIRANKKKPFSTEEDKAFMDEMWGEES